MCFRKAHRAAWKCLASSSLATPGIYYGPETGGRLECVKLKWRGGNTLCKSRCSFRRVLRGSTQYNFWAGSFQQARSERWRNGRSAYYQSIQYGAQPAFQGLHDKILRDGFVVGIKDKNLSEKLQTDPELTLKKAVDLLRQSKAAKRQKKTFDNATTVLDIDATVVQDRRIDLQMCQVVRVHFSQKVRKPNYQPTPIKITQNMSR